MRIDPLSERGPQPPKLASATLEVLAMLRQFQEHHDSLEIRFRNGRLKSQSFVLAVDFDRKLFVIDELVPVEAEQLLLDREPFDVEVFRDGVRVVWSCEAPVKKVLHDGAKAYQLSLPSDMMIHQRRNAFRANTGAAERPGITLSSARLGQSYPGELQDISASGCKIAFSRRIASLRRFGGCLQARNRVL